MINLKQKKGFSLVEVLIVVAIIGLLLTFWAITLSSKQKEIRDISRIRDVQALRNGLEVVKNESGVYDASYCELGRVSNCAEMQTSELLRYVLSLATLKDPSSPAVDCSNLEVCESQVCDYTFTRMAEDEYEIRFHLEKGAAPYNQAGCYIANQFGIAKR